MCDEESSLAVRVRQDSHQFVGTEQVQQAHNCWGLGGDRSALHSPLPSIWELTAVTRQHTCSSALFGRAASTAQRPQVNPICRQCTDGLQLLTLRCLCHAWQHVSRSGSKPAMFLPTNSRVRPARHGRTRTAWQLPQQPTCCGRSFSDGGWMPPSSPLLRLHQSVTHPLQTACFFTRAAVKLHLTVHGC